MPSVPPPDKRFKAPGYLEWEHYQAAVQGLQSLCVAGGLGAALLLGADFLLFQQGRPVGALPGLIARIALALGLLTATTLGASTLGKRGEVSRPFIRAAGITFLLVGVGALAAASAGGVDGYYPFGLLPLLMVWTAAMPSGSATAAVPLLGSLGLHLLILRLTAPSAWGPRAVGLAVFMLILVGSGLALAEIVERLRRQRAAVSRLDPLTGVLHREGVLEEVRLLCSRRARQSAAVSVVLFDLDRFRLLNTAYGRLVGDQVLEMLGGLVHGSVRAHDLVGRYGADEFLLVLDGCDGEHALQLIERIRGQLFARPIPVGNESIRVTLSAGIVCAQAGAVVAPEDLLRDVERALQESKDAQLNRTVMGPLTDGSANAEDVKHSPAVVWNFPPPPEADENAGATTVPTGLRETTVGADPRLPPPPPSEPTS